MTTRVSWDEQEALLLFDTYDKILKNPDRKNDLVKALSINLRRRAIAKGLLIDETFRNLSGVQMRLSEIDKILNPEAKGLTKTSVLFRSTAELFSKHRRTFFKKLGELEAYRVKILPDLVAFDILETVVLYDAVLSLDKPGETRAHTARLISAKLRALAVNRGCVVGPAFRSEIGISGRLRKMELAVSSGADNDNEVPQIFEDVIALYRTNRGEYRRLLRQANALIGHVVLQEDLQKAEKAKQQAHDASPVEKTKYVQTKKDRKLKEQYSRAFMAVYHALEMRSYTDSDGVTATDIYQDLKKKYLRKTIIEILDQASWAKNVRAGRYVHIQGRASMAAQESHYKKFFSWVKKTVSPAQAELIEKNNVMVAIILLQRKVIRQPLFLIEDVNEVNRILPKVPQCFASGKVKNAAVLMLTLYAEYLEEQQSREKEKTTAAEPQKAEDMLLSEFLGEAVYAPLREELARQNVHTLSALKNISLWNFMNRYDIYSIGARQMIYNRVQDMLNSTEAKKADTEYLLRIGAEEYRGATPTNAFVYFCQSIATVYPLKFRTLIGHRMRGGDDVPLHQNDADNMCVKIPNMNAYIKVDLMPETVVEYTRWVCDMCGKQSGHVTMEIVKTAVEEQGAQMEPQKTIEVDPVEEKVETNQPSDNRAKVDPRIQHLEEIVLKADMEGLSYEDVRDAMNVTMVLAKQLVSKSVKVVDLKGRLIHEDALIDWEDGADCLEEILDKLMQKNNGYVSSIQLFDYARSEMNMFLNDNDMEEERLVYDMARHLFEKAIYHEKRYSFFGNIHISRFEDGITSNLDVIKKFAADRNGVFTLDELVEYFESICLGTANMRSQMKLTSEPIFFYFDDKMLVSADNLHIDMAWKKAVTQSLKVLFEDVGDHFVLRKLPTVWFDRLPAISGGVKWTPLLLQGILRFYGKELGARTISAMDGQVTETLHTMLVEYDSPIQNFGDVVISHLLDEEIKERTFDAEELRLVLVRGGILRGNELIWNMPKALRNDPRFAWDVSGNKVTINI